MATIGHTKFNYRGLFNSIAYAFFLEFLTKLPSSSSSISDLRYQRVGTFFSLLVFLKFLFILNVIEYHKKTIAYLFAQQFKLKIGFATWHTLKGQWI